VKPPRPSLLTALGVLLALTVTIAVLPRSPLTVPVGAILVALLAAEIDRSGRHLGLLIVRIAARLLPARVRGDAQAEWADHVLSAGDAGMRPVFTAISIALLGAPRLALRYRFRLHAAKWASGFLTAYFESWQTMLEGFTSSLQRYIDDDALGTQVQDDKQSLAYSIRNKMSAVLAYAAVTMLGLIAGANVPLILLPGVGWARRPMWLLMMSGTLAWGSLITLTCLAHSPAIWVPCVSAMGLCALTSVVTLGAVASGTPGLMLRPVFWILGPAYRAELETTRRRAEQPPAP
jgi:hypothetical protein